MLDPLQQAIAAHQTGNLAEAERLYLAALEDNPSRADARYNLGMIYGQQGRPLDAIREISLALQIKPDFGQGWFMLCEFADATEQYDLSRLAAEQAVQFMPDNARAWLRYGLAFARLERAEEAIAACRRAVDLDPSLTKAWVNMCVMSKSIGRFAEAEDAIRNAIEVAGESIPDETLNEADESAYSFLHWHLALLELTTGRYREGFAHFRARFRGGTDWKRFESPKPLWRGEELGSRTILITAEQGLGDMLMIARYLPLLKQQGARVLFQVHRPLVPLFAGWAGADEVIPYGEPITSMFDYHAAIFDLPHRFGTVTESVPSPISYLPIPQPDEKTQLSGDLSPKVGVIWAGQPGNIRGKNRSISLPVFSEIFNAPGCQFYNLTHAPRVGDAELLKRYPVTDLGPLLTDFAITAEFMSQLDLIITCDTATAHLAGGMGKQVWTLLPFVADWRWGTDGEDNIWYPTMRLFRQTRIDVWDDVVERVRDALRKW